MVIVGASIAIPLALTGGGSGRLSNAAYARLWQETHTGEPLKQVLARWPKDPYQHYADGQGKDCYEWQDTPSGAYKNLPAHLYNLCFENGVLALKSVF